MKVPILVRKGATEAYKLHQKAYDEVYNAETILRTQCGPDSVVMKPSIDEAIESLDKALKTMGEINEWLHALKEG